MSRAGICPEPCPRRRTGGVGVEAAERGKQECAWPADSDIAKAISGIPPRCARANSTMRKLSRVCARVAIL